MTDRTVLHAVDLGRRFGKHVALRGVDLELAPGRVTALLGANGAGKSTLLRLAVGLLQPQTGSLRVLGLDSCRDAETLRQRIGYVPDRPDAPGALTVDELCRFAAAHYRRWDATRVDELIDRLEVPRRQRFRTLSKGQAMGAMLVLALGHDPELLLLDEPFGGLDPLVREEVLRCVLDAWRGDERTILCATHELELAARIADDVAILAEGALCAHASVEDLLGTDAPGDLPRGLHAALVRATRTSPSHAETPHLETVPC